MCTLDTTGNSWSVDVGTRGTEANRTPGCTDFPPGHFHALQETALHRPEFNFASTRASTETDFPPNSSFKILLISDFVYLFIILISSLDTLLSFKGSVEVFLAKLITMSNSVVLVFLYRCDV